MTEERAFKNQNTCSCIDGCEICEKAPTSLYKGDADFKEVNNYREVECCANCKNAIWWYNQFNGCDFTDIEYVKAEYEDEKCVIGVCDKWEHE